MATLKSEKDVRARMHALWAAARLDEKLARPLVASALEDAAPEVCAEAARLLRRLVPGDAGKRDEDRLTSLATGALDAGVRCRPSCNCGQSARSQTVVPLLADKDPFLVGAALAVLGKPGNSDLLRPAAQGKDATLRLGALLALRRAGRRRGGRCCRSSCPTPVPKSAGRPFSGWAKSG